MALPNFPTATSVGQKETLNGVMWRVRSLSPVVWEPLALNVQNYFVTPEMFGAVGNGVVDDTAALTSFFTNTTKVKMLRPQATYLATNRLTMENQQDGEVWANGARILRNQSDGMYPGQPTNPNTGYVNPGIDQHVLVLYKCKNIKISGLRIRGGYNPASPHIAGVNTSYWGNSQTNGRGEDGHGISIVQCEDIICENNEIVNVWGDAFWITTGGYLGDSAATPNKNITIRNNDIRNPFRGCFSSVHHFGLLFDNNYCEKYTGYTTAMLVEPNNNVTQNCEYTTMTNNRISCGGSGVFAATAAGALLNGAYPQHIKLSNNICSGAAFCAVNIPNTRHVTIEGNSFSNSGLLDNSVQFGLFLEAYAVRNIKVVNNTDYSGGTSDAYYRGVRLASCSNIQFDNHTIDPLYAKTNVEYFQVIDTNNFKLRHSTLKGRDTVDPNGTPIISMYGSSSNCVVIDNTFDGTGTTQGVVYLETSGFTGTNNVFEDNLITSSAGSNAVVLKANHYGTAVKQNRYTSGRVGNVAGGLPMCYQHPTTLYAGVIIAYGTAAPTTGTWVAGSRVYNAATGATDYWDCTVSGTPGTWVARN